MSWFCNCGFFSSKNKEDKALTSKPQKLHGNPLHNAATTNIVFIQEDKIKQITATASPSLHILIVEDNEVAKKILSRMLEKNIHKIKVMIKTVANGQEAVELFKTSLLPGSKPFDIIFMDHNMPVLKGNEAAQLIRQHEKTQGRSRVTIAGISDDPSLYSLDTMNIYFPKPFDQKAIVEFVKNHANLQLYRDNNGYQQEALHATPQKLCN